MQTTQMEMTIIKIQVEMTGIKDAGTHEMEVTLKAWVLMRIH